MKFYKKDLLLDNFNEEELANDVIDDLFQELLNEYKTIYVLTDLQDSPQLTLRISEPVKDEYEIILRTCSFEVEEGEDCLFYKIGDILEIKHFLIKEFFRSYLRDDLYDFTKQLLDITNPVKFHSTKLDAKSLIRKFIVDKDKVNLYIEFNDWREERYIFNIDYSLENNLLKDIELKLYEELVKKFLVKE